VQIAVALKTGRIWRQACRAATRADACVWAGGVCGAHALNQAGVARESTYANCT
jgi:hypothetical protein